MKIKTEIVQSIFIITCDGPSLDASLAQEFLTAMNSFILKSQMDILLDLSTVNFIDSTGLGSIIRSLGDLGVHRRLILCGVDDRVLGLLKMTRLDQEFTQSASRNATLSNLFWEKKNQTQKIYPSNVKPAAKQNEIEPEVQIREDDETAYAILLEVDDDHPREEEIHVSAEEESELPDGTDDAETTLHQKIDKEERRKHRRIENKQIMDEEITVYCKNTTTGKRHRAVILNISPGGLCMSSAFNLSPGDTLLLEGRLGAHFTFKEYAVSRSSHQSNYGLEFIDLSNKTIHFLDRLTGSVDMKRSNRFFHDQPN